MWLPGDRARWGGPSSVSVNMVPPTLNSQINPSLQPGVETGGTTDWHCLVIFSSQCHLGQIMFCSDWLDLDHSVATQALLCHKDTAQGTQSPLLGAFLAFRFGFMVKV